MSDRTTGGGALMVGLVVALTVFSLVLLAAVWVALRADRQLQARVAAMPGSVEAAAFWPVEVEESEAGPYLRGASVASALTGRR